VSRSRAIFKRVAAALPGLVLCKDMLVVPPTRHLVRGFLLEGTSEKGRVYLWRVVTPLYRRIGHVILDYSVRIPARGELYVHDRDEAANRIGQILKDHIAYLRSVETPADFLRHASWIGEGSTLLHRIDRALTLYLMGETKLSMDLLRALRAEADQLDARRKEHVGPLLEEVVCALDAEPPALHALLERWGDQNMERFGLEPAIGRTVSR
jgi:hypothetical protein